MILLKLSIISKVLVSNAQFYSSKSVIRIAYNFPADEKKTIETITLILMVTLQIPLQTIS